MHLRAVLVLDRCILHLLGHIVEHRSHHVLQFVTTDIDQAHQKAQQDHTKHNQQEDQRCRVATDVWLQLPIELLILGNIEERSGRCHRCCTLAHIKLKNMRRRWIHMVNVMEAHQTLLIADLHMCALQPRAERRYLAVADKGIQIEVDDQINASILTLLQLVEQPHIAGLDKLELVALQIEETQILQTSHLKVNVLQQIVAQMQIPQRGQIAEHTAILEVCDLVLLQMQLLQLHQLTVHEYVVQILAQLRRAVVLEGICEMQALQVAEIGEDTRMMMIDLVVVARNTQVVVIQYETFHSRHMVVALAAYFAYMIAAHVHNLQLLVVVDAAEHIPRQLGYEISRKDEYLHLLRHVLQHAGVVQSRVCTVNNILHGALVLLVAACAGRREIGSTAGRALRAAQ